MNEGRRFYEQDKVLDRLLFEQAWKKARHTLAEAAVKMEKFKHLYNVGKDLELVKKREVRFLEEKTPTELETDKIATVLEAIIYTQIKSNDWLGESAHIMKTCRFDDIENKVDSLIEFRKEERSASYLGLAIDVTMESEMSDKFDEIRKEIDSGKLSTIKYFDSEYTNTLGEKSQIPRVIVAADSKSIKELTGLWLEGKKEALANHPMLFQMLEEILLQLKKFREYAESKEKYELVDIYDVSISLVQKIYDNKSKTVKDSDIKDRKDRAFLTISESLNFFGDRDTPRDTIRSL